MGEPSPDARITELSFMRERVLATAHVDPPALDTAASHLATLSEETFASIVLARPHEHPLLQPRGGFARLDQQRALTRALDHAGADFVPLTVDSHTRHNDYRTAAVLLERSETEDKNLLNGYPLVCHGYRTTRYLYRDLSRPVSLRHGTPDARLLVETALAAGITDIEGGALTYTIPYSRAYPLSRALVHWQYIDRLCAELSVADRSINRESFGALTATVVPPVIVVVTELCELLLAAEQGVRSFSLSFAQTGSLLQDLAVATVLRRAADEYCDQFGFRDITTHLVYHQWMGAFPPEPDRATALIVLSAMNAELCGADKVVVKTRDEARGIPSIESNADAVSLVRYVLSHTGADARATESAQAVEEEVGRIRSEVDAVMTAVFALPQSSFLSSVSSAYETGILDVPFAPHEGNANLLQTRRGADGGIYITDPGRVPLPPGCVAREMEFAATRREGGEEPGLFRALVGDINLMLA